MRRFSGNKKNKQGEATATNANASNPSSLPRPTSLGATSASASGSSPAKRPQPMLTTDPATLLIDPPSPKQTTFEKVKGSLTQPFKRKSTSKQESSAQASGSISATAAQPSITGTIASTPLERINSPKSGIFENLTSPFSSLRKSFSSSKDPMDTSNPKESKKTRWSLTRRKNKDNDAVANLDSPQPGNIDDLNKQNVAIEKVASSDSAKQSHVSGLFGTPYKNYEFNIEEEDGSMSGNSAAKEAKQGKGEGKRKGKRKEGKNNKEKQITIQTTQGSNDEQNAVSESSLVESEKSENESSEQTLQHENSSDGIKHNASVATDEQSNAEQAVGNKELKQQGSILSSLSDVLDSELHQAKQEIYKESSKFKSELHSNISELNKTVTTTVSSFFSSGLGIIAEKDVDIKQTTFTQSNEDDSTVIPVAKTEDVAASPKKSHKRNKSMDSPLQHVPVLDTIEETKQSQFFTGSIDDEKYDPLNPTYTSLPKTQNPNTDQSVDSEDPNTTKQQVKKKKTGVSASAAQQPKDEPKSLFQRFIARIGAAFSAVGAFLYSLVKPIINVIWPEKDRNDDVTDNSSEHSQEPDSTPNHNDDSSDNDTSGLKQSNIKDLFFSNPSTNRAENNHGNTTNETRKPSKGYGFSINQ